METNEERDSKKGQTQRARRRPMAAVVDCDVPTPPPAKMKTTVLISWEAHEKLWLHCRKLKKSQDEMIEELIKEHLNRFIVQDRGGRREDEAAA